FVRENTNVVVPIQECAALAPELNEFIRLATARKIPAVTAEVVTAESAVAATFHFPDLQQRQPWERWRDALFEIPSLASLTFISGSNRLHYEKRRPVIAIRDVQYELNSDAFFQANRYLLEAFVDEVLERAGSNPGNVLELFSGSGFFSIPLAKR